MLLGKIDTGLKVRCSIDKALGPNTAHGESVGNQEEPACDMAVDPIDGMSLTANGMNGAISVIALAPRGSIYDPKLPYYSLRHGVVLEISVMSLII